jgi:hypothetical protein
MEKLLEQYFFAKSMMQESLANEIMEQIIYCQGLEF